MVTIKDVAREAGVSVATVSRVINNEPRVSQDTKTKVSAVMKRIGYRPNAINFANKEWEEKTFNSYTEALNWANEQSKRAITVKLVV